MITLLLALFIVLFAMSTIDSLQFAAVAKELSQSFRGQVFNQDKYVAEGSKHVLDPANNQQQMQEAQSAEMESMRQDTTQLQHIEQAVTKSISKQDADKLKLKVTSNEKGIVIRLAGDVFFESGSAHIRPPMTKVIAKIAASLKADKHYIAVEGHTDGAPINSAQFPSNWELSSARAQSIANFLMARGVAPTRVSVTGYADTRPVQKPKHPHDSVSPNRRVEIVLKAITEGDGPTKDVPRAYDPLDKAGSPSNVATGGSVIPTIIDLSGGTT
jgi:chemotaxis protein MotB